MAKLLIEEPDALMRARPDLWEPRGGNTRGHPARPHESYASIWRQTRLTAMPVVATPKTLFSFGGANNPRTFWAPIYANRSSVYITPYSLTNLLA